MKKLSINYVSGSKIFPCQFIAGHPDLHRRGRGAGGRGGGAGGGAAVLRHALQGAADAAHAAADAVRAARGH